MRIYHCGHLKEELKSCLHYTIDVGRRFGWKEPDKLKVFVDAMCD